MLNMDRLNNSIDDDMVSPPNATEMNTESISIDRTNSRNYIRPTILSQMVVDEKSNYSNEITNQSMEDLILHQFRFRRPSILVNESDTLFGESRAWTEGSIFNYGFAANRHESNDGIAYTSDTLEYILINLLSPPVIRLIFDVMWNSSPLGIQDTQPHTMVLPVNTAPQDIIIDNENGDINEDATGFNDDDELMVNENINGDVTVRESTGAETADEITNNINPVVATDAQDNHHSDIDNQNERVIDDDHNSAIAHQDNLNNYTDERDQVSPRPEHNENTPSNIPSIPLLSSSIPRTLTTGSSEQAAEMEPLLAGPTNNNDHTTEDSTLRLVTDPDVSQLNVHIQKQTSLLTTSEEVGDNKNVS